MARFSNPALLLIPVGAWVALFFFVFFAWDNQAYTWSRGEVGDFLGGGLSAMAIFFVAWTASLQAKQLNRYGEHVAEENAFKTFEVFRREAEGVAAKIVSEAMASSGALIEGKSFEALRTRFHVEDSTVFVRTIRKPVILAEVQRCAPDSEMAKAIRRYLDLVKVIEDSVEELEPKPLCRAIKASEIYETYVVLGDAYAGR